MQPSYPSIILFRLNCRRCGLHLNAFAKPCKEAEKTPSESAFWNDDVLDYVETLLRRASDLTERRLPPGE